MSLNDYALMSCLWQPQALVRDAAEQAGLAVESFLDDREDGVLTFWMWPASATEADEQRKLAVGIQVRRGEEGIRLLDGSFREIGRAGCLLHAAQAAGCRMGALVRMVLPTGPKWLCGQMTADEVLRGLHALEDRGLVIAGHRHAMRPGDVIGLAVSGSDDEGELLFHPVREGGLWWHRPVEFDYSQQLEESVAELDDLQIQAVLVERQRREFRERADAKLQELGVRLKAIHRRPGSVTIIGKWGASTARISRVRPWPAFEVTLLTGPTVDYDTVEAAVEYAVREVAAKAPVKKPKAAAPPPPPSDPDPGDEQLRARILNELRQRGEPVSSSEMARLVGVGWPQVWNAMVEMRNAGVIEGVEIGALDWKWGWFFRTKAPPEQLAA